MWTPRRGVRSSAGRPARSGDGHGSREAAEAKGRTGPVCGEADILLVPDIACGNVLLKALRYGCGAESAGLVVGGRAPIVLTSRAAQTRDKLLPLRLASLFSL